MKNLMTNKIVLLLGGLFVLTSCSPSCNCWVPLLKEKRLMGRYISNDDQLDTLIIAKGDRYIHKFGSDSISTGSYTILDDCAIRLNNFKIYIDDIIKLKSGRKTADYWLKYCPKDKNLYVNIVDWSGEMGYSKLDP